MFDFRIAIFNDRCGVGLFNCSKSECISSNKLCDGVKDCRTNDGADEDNSLCSMSSGQKGGNCHGSHVFVCFKFSWTVEEISLHVRRDV